jgi:hypothetical protein
VGKLCERAPTRDQTKVIGDYIKASNNHYGRNINVKMTTYDVKVITPFKNGWRTSTETRTHVSFEE